jgi:hypothetical protein
VLHYITNNEISNLKIAFENYIDINKPIESGKFLRIVGTLIALKEPQEDE